MVAQHPGVPVTVESVAPDGSKTMITVGGKQVVGNGATDLDQWLEDQRESPAERH